MIKAYYLLATVIIISACSPVLLTRDMTDAQAYKLYRHAQQQSNEYFLSYNPDSTYVICTVNDSSQLVMQPITFLVVNLQDREKTLVSINEYHKTQWLDNSDILLVRYSGIANFDRSLKSRSMDNRIEYIFNVQTKELLPKPKADQEKF